jgi:hypothetical protein
MIKNIDDGAAQASPFLYLNPTGQPEDLNSVLGLSLRSE